METKKELKTFQVDYQCGKCKKGFMRAEFMSCTVASLPAQYPHACNNSECDATQTFLCIYPKTVYELSEN